MILLSAGIGTLMACANLFFRDVTYIVQVILTFGIFFTPVFYEAEMFGEYKDLLLINPLAPILEAFNNVVVHHQMPELQWLAYSGVFSLFIFGWSFRLFKKLEPTFAENI